MADPITIDRISLTKLKSTTPNYSKTTTTNTIPGGVGQESPFGINPPKISLDCTANSASAVQALREIQQNPDWKYSYITFPTSEAIHNGWYLINSVETPNNPGLGIFPVRVQVTKIAASSEVRQAEMWTSASESASGWTSPSTQKFIPLPNGTSYFDSASGTRSACGGSVPFFIDPTKNIAAFKSSSTISDSYKTECQCWDTETACNLTETGWTRVFGKSHAFRGDMVFQNGLIRYNTSSSVDQMGTFYVWDNVSSPSAWSSIGNLSVAVDADISNHCNIVGLEIIKLTPDEIQWREWRLPLSPNSVKLDFTMRRGAYHVRVKLTTYTSGLSGSLGGVALNLAGAGISGSPYDFIFNAGASGLSASGDLPKQTSSNYMAGFSIFNDWVAGFVLANSPTQQPYAAGGGPRFLFQSNDWGTSTSQIFWVYGFAYNTSIASVSASTVVVAARPISASIAAQAMQNIDQKSTLVGNAFYA